MRIPHAFGAEAIQDADDPGVPDNLKDMSRADLQRLLMFSTELAARLRVTSLADADRESGFDPADAASQSSDPFADVTRYDPNERLDPAMHQSVEKLLIE